MSAQGRISWALWVMALGAFGAVEAQDRAAADVVVVVDTSTSMTEKGMDPQWASLLVTKLLVDIVPGDLAVVRLLDLAADGDLLPHVETDRVEPCPEDPSRDCHMVEPASNWQEDARRDQLGLLPRPRRGDPDFKNQLNGHLERRIHNSFFDLAFRSAQGFLDEQRRPGKPGEGRPQVVLWLSDGRSDDPDATRRALRDLETDEVTIEAIIFGQGDPSLAQSAGLEVQRASSPAEIMKAFAGSFRRVVQAPYEVDNLVASQPSFEMKVNVDEAWVVVYGDDGLGEVRLEGPSGDHAADYAADRWEGAGAYRVAYFEKPATGRWTVHATGGGAGVAYAVVQRSALTPALLAPDQATSGLEVQLIAGVRAGLGGELLTDPQVLGDLTVTARFEEQTVTLRDDGGGGDAAAGDGRYGAAVIFRGLGQIPVELRLFGDVVDRSILAHVEISSSFVYPGGPVAIDFGVLEAGTSSCRPVLFVAEHRGKVPLELRATQSLPDGLGFEVHVAGGKLRVGGPALGVLPEESFEICLETTRLAPSSSSRGERWLELGVAGGAAQEQRVPLELTWQVEGLTFWQLWGWLILWILGLLIAAFFVGGYVIPARFKGSLAVTFVPERDELDEQAPQPVKQWKGVGIGFYRPARAYLHGDFRLSGDSRGALAVLRAERGSMNVMPGKGAALSRETLDGDWETVPPAGRRGRAGDIYRVADKGPYFRIAAHRGRG